MRQEERVKTKRRSSISIFIVILCVITAVLGAYAISGDTKESLPIDDINNYIVSLPQYQVQPSQTASKTFTFEQLAELCNGHLLLVNLDYAVPLYTPGNLVKISDYVWTLNPSISLNEDALYMLRVLFDSAASIGFTQFRVTQGFRTHEYQQGLYARMTGSGLAAPPGHSEHQVGLAVDISYHGVNIRNSRQGTWLMNNSYRYGFILRYPEHKTDITGLPFEPWHYRFVGQPHAYFMRGRDFVLEEYIAYLESNRAIAVVFDNTLFKIHYLSGADETIEIPENYWFSASLDNTGGLIVTIWPD